MAPKVIQWRAKTGVQQANGDEDPEKSQQQDRKSCCMPFEITLRFKPAERAPGIVKLHVFNKGVKIWHERYHHMDLAFRKLSTRTDLTVTALMRRIAAGRPGIDLDQIAVTEVIEAGDGVWTKGTTIRYDDEDRASATLASLGWTQERGVTLPPVWLCLHKI